MIYQCNSAFSDEWQSCSCSTLKSVAFIWMTNWWDGHDVWSIHLHSIQFTISQKNATWILFIKKDKNACTKYSKYSFCILTNDMNLNRQVITYQWYIKTTHFNLCFYYTVTYLLNLLPFSLQRKEAVALHVKLLDLNNEFLAGSHMPNRIARSVIPEHLHLQFASEGSFIQVGGLHADSPDDLVCRNWNISPFCSAGGAVAHVTDPMADVRAGWKRQ